MLIFRMVLTSLDTKQCKTLLDLDIGGISTWSALPRRSIINGKTLSKEKCLKSFLLNIKHPKLY